MGQASRAPARTRRWFLASLPAACFAVDTGRGRLVPSAVTRYPDPTTEFPVYRLTDPAHTSHLPSFFARAISRRSNSLVYASDISGRFEAFRMDLKSGQSRQLTDASALDPFSLTLFSDDRGFCYLDGGRLVSSSLSSLRPREIYRTPDEFEESHGLSVAEDGLFSALVERKGSHSRLQLVNMSAGTAVTLAECEEEIRDPIPRPRRASVLYRRGNAIWLANYDAQQNYRLRLAEGGTGPALWSPDGRSVLYLNYPDDPHKLHNLRDFTPDTNEDKAIANTTQFVHFGRNADASVFVGASGSKASPHVLLLVRVVRRELTLAEHHASDPHMVAPIFSPNSQHVFFASDQHGKPAIYSVTVDRLVSETEAY